MSDSPERLAAAARGVALARQRRKVGEANVFGSHLEGPWLAPARRGGRDMRWLRAPGIAELEHIADLAAGGLRIVTIAPELPGATAVIRAGAGLVSLCRSGTPTPISLRLLRRSAPEPGT